MRIKIKQLPDSDEIDIQRNQNKGKLTVQLTKELDFQTLNILQKSSRQIVQPSSIWC